MPAEKNPAVIYLGPACQEQADGREWCQDDVWEACECGHESVCYVLAEDFDRVTAENAALQLRLNAADQRGDDQASLIAELIAGWDAAQFGDPPTRLAKAIKSARLNPTTEAASHDE